MVEISVYIVRKLIDLGLVISSQEMCTFICRKKEDELE